MRVPRSIWVHAGLVIVSGVFATYAWSREQAPEGAPTEVTIWGGRPGDVKSIRLETKNKKVVLEPRSDSKGRWLFGTIERERATTPHTSPHTNPHADQASGEKETINIVSVTAADRLLERVAPFKAVRALGKIADDKLGDFGLKDAAEAFTVRVGGAERKLLVGSLIPGASDRYVMDAARHDVYVVRTDAISDIESADWRLAEHDQHEWQAEEPTSAKIVANGKTRRVVRGGSEGKHFWADPAVPDKNDETVGNYIQKIERLRGQEFAPTGPEGATPVVRIEYMSGSSPLGFLDLVKTPSKDSGHKFDYWFKTELTRLYAKAQGPTAEQIEQDLGSVLH